VVTFSRYVGVHSQRSGCTCAGVIWMLRCAVVTNNDGRPAATSGEVETLRREWARHEQVMRSIGDTMSAEGGIARRAFDRLTDITAELQLDSNIVELAHQVCFCMTDRRKGCCWQLVYAHHSPEASYEHIT
jgi:hypothetical protein